MRIAFDVKGTLYGDREILVRRLLEEVKKAGHQVIVWSNSYQYALDAVKDLKLDGVEAMLKYGKWDKHLEPMDICIEDDRSQEWLSADRIVFVDDREAIVALIKEHTISE